MRFYIYLSIVFLTVVFGVWNLPRLNSLQKKILLICIWTLITEIAGRIAIYQFGSSIPPYHFYIPALTALQGWIYYEQLSQTPFKKVLPILIILCIGLQIKLSFFPLSLLTFPSMQNVVLSSFVILMVLITTQHMLKTPILTPLHKQPLFLFLFSNFFFQSVSFFIFALFNPFLKNNMTLPGWFYYLLFTANFILYSVYFFCLLINEKPAAANHSSNGG